MRALSFTARMMRANLAGAKTETRRLYDAGKTGNIPQIGDQFYARETWAVSKTFNHYPGSAIPRDNGLGVWYPADCASKPEWAGRKRVARFMPRRFSRFTARVTAVRIEDLRDLTPEGAIAEGVFHGLTDADPSCAVEAFRALWDSIHPNYPFQWADNPLVMVIAYEQVNEKQ